MEKQIITVEGMSCHHCEMAVQNAVLALLGVKKAKASFKKSQVILKLDTSLVSIEAIKSAINEIGYTA